MKSVTIIYFAGMRLSPGRKLPFLMFYVYSGILVFNQRGGRGGLCDSSDCISA